MDTLKMPIKLPCDNPKGCEGNYGGSHYHCGNCLDPKPTSMMGHFVNGEFTCYAVKESPNYTANQS